MNGKTQQLQQAPSRLAEFVRVHVARWPLPKPSPERRGAAPWLTIIVVLGLSLRGYHYFTNPPVWHDEAAQIYNVLHKDYRELLGPLYYSEACPPLFLALEKLVVQILGDSTFALRLVPFLASCLALVALVLLARTILQRPALLWFATLLACSDRLLWHASEAKPYAVDVLVATGVLALGLKFQSLADHDTKGLRRWLIVAAGISPLLIFLSFPACFLLGGLALTLLPPVWRSRSRSTWLAFLSFGVLLGGAFLLLYATAIQAQKNERILSCWVDKFPPWDEPWLVPLMAVVRLTELARYTLEPAGNVLCPLAVAGGITLWRAGRKRLVALLVLPIALNAVAWLARSYPMEASRVVIYAAPAVLLLVAAGIPGALAWARRRGRWAAVVLVAILMVPIVQPLWVFYKPWARLDSAAPTAFVMAHRQANEPVVGTLWEQNYYCRRLGSYYRALFEQPLEPLMLPPTAQTRDGQPTGACVTSLWLLSSHDPALQAAQIALLEPGGPWQIAERHEFRDVVVLRLIGTR